MSSTQVQGQAELPSLEAVVRQIDEISTLPDIAVRVMQVAQDERTGAADLKEIMENDVALSARVLRCVNSSAYAVRIKITNLQQAIAYLGLKQVRNLAMTASVSDLFRKEGQIGPYCRRGLWKHLVSVGICARLIAMRRGIRNFEDAFLAGLLHDVGIVLEDQHLHSRFVRVIQGLNPTKTLAEVERGQMGFDHAMLGEKVAESWSFPDSIVRAIRYHHMAMNARGEDVEIVRCVEVANLICTLKGITSVGLKLVKVCKPTMASLSMTGDDVAVIAEDLDQELLKNATLFTL